MPAKRRPKRRWRPLVEQDPHPQLGRFQAALRVLQNLIHLRALDARKPFKELLHRRATFEIFEERLYGHTRAFEQPGATDLSRMALNSTALGPIDHLRDSRQFE